jgi:hypothetical protein
MERRSGTSETRHCFLHYTALFATKKPRTDYGHGDTSSELNAIARFKAMEGLDPRSNGKFFPTIPDGSTGFDFESGRTEPVTGPASIRRHRLC